MENCLIQSLKGNVNNPSLPKVGALKLKIVNSTAQSSLSKQGVVINAVGDTRVETTGSGYFGKGSLADMETHHYTDETFSDPTGNFVFSEGDYYVNVFNKYNIKGFRVNSNTSSIINVNIDELKYSINLEELVVSKNSYGDVANLAELTLLTVCNLSSSLIEGNTSVFADKTSLTELQLTNSKVTGDIEDFANLTALTDLRCAATAIGGDISSLGKLTSLTTLNLRSSKVRGSVEGFVAAQIENGRTSVSTPISTPQILTYATFGDNLYSEATNSWLKWESSSKITVFANGTSYSDALNIYAKGATAEEIEAWEQAGKTVIEIE